MSRSPIPSGRRSLVALGGAVAILAAALGAVSILQLTADAARPSSASVTRFDGPVFPPELRASSFSLTDQNGRRATHAQYRGRVVVVSFMYSHCHDTCPLMATEIRGALAELPHAGRGVPVLAISVDPSHDTRASARAFIAREGLTGRMRFLLGSRRQLEPIWHRYAIQPELGRRGRPENGGHSSYVILIDRRGFERVGFPAGQLVPEDLAHDIRLLLTAR